MSASPPKSRHRISAAKRPLCANSRPEQVQRTEHVLLDHLIGHAEQRRRHREAKYPRSATTEQRNELTPPHSITSSVRPRSPGGRLNPIDLAVLRFTVSQNRVGISAGRSDGFLPFKILSTKVAHYRELGETAGKRRCKARSAINFWGSAG